MRYYAFNDSCQALVGNYFSPSTGELIPARCKKWSCKFCGPRRARRWVARVSRARNYSYFVTLTAGPHGAVTRDCVRSFNASWRSWLQWLKRETAVNDVSWVLEQGGRSGHLHRHALIHTRRSFSYKRARAALVRTGHGAVCDFKPIRCANGAAAGASYIGKYLGKALGEHRTQWPRYARRAQTTVPDERQPTDLIFVPRDRQDWRRWPERDTPLVNEYWLARDMPGYQLSIALNHQEKLRQEEWLNDLEKHVGAAGDSS